jgi:transposase-like protein
MAAFKARVALARYERDRTSRELPGHYGVNPTLIHAWKRQHVSDTEEIFGSPATADAVAH